MTRKSIDVVTWLKNWFESKSNKVTSLSASSTDTQYPSAKAVYDEIQNNSGGCVEDYYFDTTTKEIIIDYVCGSGSGSGGSGGSVTIDDSWIADSTNPVQSKIIKLALDGKAASDHTHSQYLTEHQSLSNYVQKSNTTGLLKNDGSVMTGGTGSTNYAIGNHTHSNYITSSSLPTKTSDLNNDGDGTYSFITTYDIENMLSTNNVANDLTTTTSGKVLDARQGKILSDMIGQAITYINQ